MKNQRSLVAVVSVFFFWGFLAASNGVFIPYCKSHFQLTQFQSQLIDSAFYGAYFSGALLLLLSRKILGKDLMQILGFKRALLLGIAISVLGALFMITALQLNSLPFILASFFTIALGFSLQQTAANPLTILLGNPENGSKRLNLAGGINSLGTAVGPLVIGKLLAGNNEVAHLYLIFAFLFVIVAVFVFKSLDSSIVEASLAVEEDSNQDGSSLRNLLAKNKQLKWGMLAIFVYVGVEVTIQSNLGALLKTAAYGNIQGRQLSAFVSMYWGGLMVGRWIAGISLVQMKNTWLKYALIISTAYAAFALVLLFNYLNGNSTQPLLPLGLFILPYAGAFCYFMDKPTLAFRAFAAMGSACLMVAILTQKDVSLAFLLASGISCSIMWPGIFALSISGLKENAGLGSGLLIMMVLGGACIPPTQGLIADWLGIKNSYIVPLLGFLFLSLYAVQATHYQQKLKKTFQ